MRLGLLGAVMLLSGCVSQTPGYPSGDEFDLQQAAKTRISLGLTYLKNGNYQQAKVNLDKALEFAPRYADAHYSLAYYYQTVEEWARADSAYEDALKLAPRNPDIANSYGAFLCQQRRYEEATEYFTKALDNQQYANSAETYENMAICAQAQGETDEALRYLVSALNHQPSRAKSLFMLTQIYISQGRWNEAENAMRRYEKVARVSPESIQLAIEIATGKGDTETAEGYGEMLVTMYPQSVAAKAYKAEMLSQTNASAQIVRTTKPKAAHAPEATTGAPVTSQNSVKPQASIPIKTNPSHNPKMEPAIKSDDAGAQSRYHVVQKGENLYRISLKYNLKMAKIQEWNDLPDPGDIVVGMRLRLTAPQ
ncbi:type IV pilus biogenesis/stability protein PilW [Aestuariibacter sp. A3R04]|uniref:type IV pilus biogenesis/stability protein PilW n=1 Tax=Aestuariibacter sp. A3R04 TaxID=2841571 RepID=UPI001C09DD25|nr:type IV pilus biogenesis/stability protein PilW [Aestuariibacter sp. A3R04]MBU3021810.1 type IV pilus biogenesis/stability protein PilW [Aestuariibacter sp. A3R04]